MAEIEVTQYESDKTYEIGELKKQWAGDGLHLDEVVYAWDERDKRECAVLYGRLFRESVIQVPLELIRRAADVKGLTEAINNLEQQRQAIIGEVMAGIGFLSKKIQAPIDVAAKDLSEIIDTELLLLEMTRARML